MSEFSQRKAIVEEYALEALSRSMEAETNCIYRTLLSKNQILAQYRRVQADLDAVKAELVLSDQVNGKNAEARAAQLTLLLKQHPLRDEGEHLRLELDRLDTEIRRAELQYGVVKTKLAAATAALTFLAG